MKNWKKKISLLIVAVLSLTLLAACSGDTTGTSSPEASTQETAASGTETTAQIPSEEAEVQTIILTTYGQPRPYTYVNENDEVVGYDIDVARAVFDLLPQYELEIQLADLAAVLGNLDAGYAQISANQWVKSKDREEKYLFSDPIMSLQCVALFQEGTGPDAEEIDLTDLAGLTTIVQPGSNVSVVLEEYNTANPDNQIIINYSDEDIAKNYTDLADGQIDFLLYNKASFRLYQNEYGLSYDIVSLNEETNLSLLGSEPYSFFVIASDQPELQAAVNGALRELYENGTLTALSEQYLFGDDYAPHAFYGN